MCLREGLEEKIQKWIFIMNLTGYDRNKTEILNKVQELIKANNIPINFEDDCHKGK